MEMDPIVDGIEENYHGKLSVVKVSVDSKSGKQLARELGCIGTPSFVLFNRAGEQTLRLQGAESADKFEKEIETFKIQGALFEGEQISLDRLKEIAALPSREELLAKIVGGLQSPIYGIVFVLKENLRKLTSLLSEISKKKG